MSTKFQLYLGTVSPQHRVDADSLGYAMRSYVRLLKELDRTTAEGKFKWYVSGFSLGSATVEILPDWPQALDEPPEGELELLRGAILERFVTGIEQLEQGERRPDGFSPVALKEIENLGNVIDGEISEIRVWQSAKPERELHLTKRIAARATELLNEKSIVFGSVEGKVVTLSLNQGGYFYIYDEGSASATRCPFPGEDDIEKIRSAFGERITVQGEIEYSAERKPVRVTRLVNWWTHDDPPTPVDELIGAFEYFTDGLPAEEFLNQETDE